MSAHERTGWRDDWISRKHREWSKDLPAMDLDGVVTREGIVDTGWMEYDHCQPVAIVEYKDSHACLNIYDANNTALANLAGMAGLPFFIVVYNKASNTFRVIPRNERAEQLLPGQDTPTYTEKDYVDFLHRVRGRQMPDWLKDKLENTVHDELLDK